MAGAAHEDPVLAMQLLAADQGTQLPAECPGWNARSREPHMSPVHPTYGKILDEMDHRRRQHTDPGDGGLQNVLLPLSHPPEDTHDGEAAYLAPCRTAPSPPLAYQQPP